MDHIANKGTFLGHPKGLFLLFGTEMWERMSYYGMRGIFVLYLTTLATAGAMGWDMSYFDINPDTASAAQDYTNALQANALSYLGTYAMLVYLTPVLGGWLADNKLGQRKAVIIGAVLMMLGQFALGTPYHFIEGFEVGFLWLGLGLLIVGNGFFKPNISTMVGDLYQEGDRRRDSAFTIFYMGINLGSILGYFLVGTIGEKINYQYGFIVAGIGMGIGILIQLFFADKYLGDLGKTPSAIKDKKQNTDKKNITEKQPLTPIERDRMKVFLVLSLFNVIFWAGFEQAAGVLNLFAKNNTDLFILGFEMPASWLQSVNPIFVILLAPILASLWVKMGDKNPSSPAKFALGLFFLALGFACMVGAAIQIGETQSVKASIWWLVLAYLFHTIGELCLSPVGLSMVTKISPVRFMSLMMGLWFVFMAFGNKLAAEAGKLVGTSGPFNTFLGVTLFALAAAAVLYLIREKLVDWMHGAENTKALDEETALEAELAVTGDHDGINTKHIN